MSEYDGQISDKVDALKTKLDERTYCEEIFEKECPREWGRYTALQKEIPHTQEELKTLLRKRGRGGVFHNHTIGLQNRTKTVVETEELLLEAEERGDLEALLAVGALTYQVNTHQIERLDGPLRAIYSKFVSQKPATKAVILPADLK